MSEQQQLSSLLNREIDCLQRLLDILQQEYEALTSADIEALETVTLSKNQTLAEQAELARMRSALVVSASCADSSEGLQHYIAGCDNSSELLVAVEKMTALAEQCQHSNRENGRLISQKQHQARGALDVLRQTEHNSPTYSDHGKSTTKESSRSLGKA